jgi:cation diffusion facilitator CzcD-associated flavoprotein CzcO
MMSEPRSKTSAADNVRKLDAVIVGAGFAGLYMLHKLREQGMEVLVLEAADGVGGTWYWNRYPGARCDVESMEYSYQFSDELQQQWQWTERYASQPEILKYINHVADRFDLRRDIKLNTQVSTASYDEGTASWRVNTNNGDELSARFCIMATGCLSSTNLPKFKGLDDFTGPTYHTGQWPHAGVDFTGLRVGIIGTGSSAVQAIPIIAEQAKHLTVFQRTPNYSVPARNGPLPLEVQQSIKAEYQQFRKTNNQMPFAFGSKYNFREDAATEATQEELRTEYEQRWRTGGLPFLGAFGDLLFDMGANDTAGDFIRNKIHETVQDTAVAETLSPRQVVGCKRLCADTNYYETYNRPNVTLVDISGDPIECITPDGVRAKGENFEFDCIVFATGFDAMTGALFNMDIRGRDGLELREKWSAGPRTYLGLTTAGFPNFFTISGPGSPSVLTNMLPSIEQHVEWIADCVAYLQSNDYASIEPSSEAEDAWVDHVNAVADTTLYPTCNSWYLGANVPGKPRVFMPYVGFPPYVEKCNEVVAKGYDGFKLSAVSQA